MLATSALMDIGVKQVWAKAITEPHGRILHRIGAHHVVFPEADAGERVAHLLAGKMIDFIEFDDDFAIVKTRAPVEAHGRSLGESKLRAKYGVTVVGVKRPGGDFTPAQASTTVEPGDILIIAGATKAVEKFRAAGFTNAISVEGGTTAWEKVGLPVVRGATRVISLERQVRIAAGSLVLLGVLLGWLVHPTFFALSAFVGAGLVFAGITDWCGMGMLLAKMPWNQCCYDNQEGTCSR